jgi:hypothetical protein
VAAEQALSSVQSIQQDRLLVLNGTLGIDNVIAGSIRLDLETVRGGTRLLPKHWAIGELALAAQERFAKGWNGLGSTANRLACGRANCQPISGAEYESATFSRLQWVPKSARAGPRAMCWQRARPVRE